MTVQPLLLDTCALIWMTEDAPLAPEADKLLDDAFDAGISTYISPVSAWELGMLASRGRLRLALSPLSLFRGALDQAYIKLAPTSPELLIDSSFLPGKPPSDPIDRILAATARGIGCTLLTRDRRLLDYGEKGHISVVRC